MTEYYANWPFDQQPMRSAADETKKKLIDHIKLECINS